MRCAAFVSRGFSIRVRRRESGKQRGEAKDGDRDRGFSRNRRDEVEPGRMPVTLTVVEVADAEQRHQKQDLREFEEFAFLAAAPKKFGTVNWDARQTYQDGSTVAWTGSPQSDNPHSQTVFTAPRGACGRPPRSGSVANGSSRSEI